MKELGVARTPKSQAPFHGEDTSDTEVSQLPLSSWGELESVERLSDMLEAFPRPGQGGRARPPAVSGARGRNRLGAPTLTSARPYLECESPMIVR
jgi:hypothetical protein